MISKQLMQQVRRRLKQDTADLVNFAEELIRIPSENPPGDGYSRCAKLIARWLRDLEIPVRLSIPAAKGRA